MRAFLFYGVPKSLFVILLLAPFWMHAQFSVMEDAVALSNNCVQLTAAAAGQRGAAWAECPLDVSQPFSIELTVYLGNNNGDKARFAATAGLLDIQAIPAVPGSKTNRIPSTSVTLKPPW